MFNPTNQYASRQLRPLRSDFLQLEEPITRFKASFDSYNESFLQAIQILQSQLQTRRHPPSDSIASGFDNHFGIVLTLPLVQFRHIWTIYTRFFCQIICSNFYPITILSRKIICICEGKVTTHNSFSGLVISYEIWIMSVRVQISRYVLPLFYSLLPFPYVRPIMILS